jgi:hypothetical protein
MRLGRWRTAVALQLVGLQVSVIKLALSRGGRDGLHIPLQLLLLGFDAR